MQKHLSYFSLCQTSGEAEIAAEAIVIKHFLSLFNFIGSTKHSPEQIAELAEEAAGFFIDTNAKKFSLSEIVHCISLIKTSSLPFTDVKFYGIQPREILRLFNVYKQHAGKKIQEAEKKRQRAEIEESKKRAVPMPENVQEALQQLQEKLEKQKTRATSPKLAKQRTVRLIEKVELWILENVPPIDQAAHFAALKKDWTKKYNVHCSGVVSKVIKETEFFELCAEEFLKDQKHV